MKQIILTAIAFTFSIALFAQRNGDVRKASGTKFGIKAGYNIAKYTGSSPSFSPDTKNGFMASVFYAPTASTGIGYRSELVFSRQGFGFNEDGKQSDVSADYIYIPQFTTIGITKFLQLQVGGQIGYLLKSSKQTENESKSTDITSFTNRVDYGAAFGVELYPFKGLIIGGRYNMSFGDTYKTPQMTNPIPSPLPFNPSDVKGKNAVINFFVGYRF